MAYHHPALRPLSSISPISSYRLRTVLRMIPLVCAAWCGNALAVDVIYQGPPGSSGLAGATPGAPGTAGGAAPPAPYLLFGADPVNTLLVNGGAGGAGGNGANGNTGQTGGAAGAGGAGADTSAELTVAAPATGASLAVTANGGLGGNAGQPGSGAQTGAGAAGGVGGTAFANGVLTSSGSGAVQGAAQATGGQGGRSTGVLNGAAGGAALSNLTTVALGSGAASVRSIATGGQGAAANVDGTSGGAGGNASANAGVGNPNATLASYSQEVRAIGGAGGHANLDFDNAPFAYGGNGGDAAANTSSAFNSSTGTLTLVQSATGGAGGDTVFAYAGRGGNATSTITSGLGGALNASVDSIATGGIGGNAAGNPFNDPISGAPGAGGNATSTVSLAGNAPAAGSWNAVIAATSTALAGLPGVGAFSGGGGTADATVTVAGYGRVTGTALATGAYGGNEGGAGIARATVDSSYSAVANATANGGGAFFNPGAAATARADARSAWHASADAVAMSGSGRFGNTEAGSAIAQASVTRALGMPAPPLPPASLLAPEARAHALASFRGGEVLARSSYSDASLGAAVVTTAGSAQPAEFYQPEAYSAANVGGAAYGAWTPDPAVGMVSSYASALPDPASLSTLLTASPNIAAAFDDAQLLGAGTMGAMFFPFSATAQFSVPFTAGRHLLLGLGLPFVSEFDTANFEFSVSNGATELYAGSFNNPDQAALFFSDNVLDLGVFNTSTLDLLVRFSFNGGIYGFNYVLGAGDALTPVPEPGTWLMLVLGLALLTWRARTLRSASH